MRLPSIVSKPSAAEYGQGVRQEIHRLQRHRRHLLFAAGMTVYILVGTHYEERDLRRALPATSLPSRLVALAEIPRTGSGKAIRQELLGLDRRPR